MLHAIIHWCIFLYLLRKGQFLNVRGEKISEAQFYEVLKGTITKIWADTRLADYCCTESVVLEGMDIPNGEHSFIYLIYWWKCASMMRIMHIYRFQYPSPIRFLGQISSDANCFISILASYVSECPELLKSSLPKQTSNCIN